MTNLSDIFLFSKVKITKTLLLVHLKSFEI